MFQWSSNGHPHCQTASSRTPIQVDFADPALLEVRPLGLLWVMFWAPQHPNIQCVIIIFPIGMFQVAIFGVFLWGIHHFFGGRFQHDIADADGFMGIIAGVLHLHDRIWREGAPRNCKP